MALQGYIVKKVTRSEITLFIEKYHYSGSINGCIADFCYALYSPDKAMKGAMFFGRLAMANQWKRFADNESDVIELRRLVLVDDTPRNAESYFIGKAIKKLAKEWAGHIIVSYADKEYGHTGIIYKAANFLCLGEKPGAKVIMYNGKKYHDKAIRTKYKGELKPFAKEIKDALKNGTAEYKDTAGKVTYIYKLKKRKVNVGNLAQTELAI